MTIVPLEKSISIENHDGSITNWSKDIFDILIDISNINPSEKILTFSFCLINKKNGARSFPSTLQQSITFSRFPSESIINQKEFDKFQFEKQKIESKIQSLESFIFSNNQYVNSNELSDDEKEVVLNMIEDKKLDLEMEKDKLSKLVPVELKYEKGEDFDTVVREYFNGFNLNEKGKAWITDLAKKNLF